MTSLCLVLKYLIHTYNLFTLTFSADSYFVYYWQGNGQRNIVSFESQRLEKADSSSVLVLNLAFCFIRFAKLFTITHMHAWVDKMKIMGRLEISTSRCDVQHMNHQISTHVSNPNIKYFIDLQVFHCDLSIHTSPFL